jgi:hypothetical protein
MILAVFRRSFKSREKYLANVPAVKCVEARAAVMPVSLMFVVAERRRSLPPTSRRNPSRDGPSKPRTAALKRLFLHGDH